MVFYRPWTYVKQLVHEFMFRFAIVCEISFCHDVVGHLCVVPKRHLFNNEAGIYLARFYRKHHPKTGILTYTNSLPDLAYGKTWQNVQEFPWFDPKIAVRFKQFFRLPCLNLILSTYPNSSPPTPPVAAIAMPVPSHRPCPRLHALLLLGPLAWLVGGFQKDGRVDQVTLW